MKQRIGMLIAAVLLALASVLGCSLTDSVSKRLASEPTATRAPTKTPRPTFTPTPNWTPTPTVTSTPTVTPIPTATPVPTVMPLPPATPTPVPTKTPKPKPRPPTDTPEPEVPTDTPAPVYPFMVAEQSDRNLTHTTNTGIIDFISITDANNTPLGDLRVVGDSSLGQHVVSLPSCWDWCTTTGLRGGYVKAANTKFEPGPFIDGSWVIYIADGAGTQLSPKVTLSYNTDPSQWVWDFVAFKKK